jgi:hypothetical protein
MFWLARRNELASKDGRPCVHDSYDHGFVCTLFQKLWFTIGIPSFIYAGIKIYMACHLFDYRLSFVMIKRVRTKGDYMADELATAAAAIESLKIDV